MLQISFLKKKFKILSKVFARPMFLHKFALAKYATDSVAQQVEHIPFKDGVLGSSPSWITKKGRHSTPAFFVLSETCYFDSTGICLLIDSSSEMRVSVRVIPVTDCIFSVSTSRRCSLSLV